MKRAGVVAALVGLAAGVAAQDRPDIRADIRPDIRVDVELVTVACSVTDRGGAPVKNLTASDFTIRDDGEPRTVTEFWQESDLPLTIGLVVDASGSQAEFVAQHRDTIERFLSQVLGERDRAFLVQINGQARLVTDLTGSIEELREGVEKIGTREGSASPMLGERCRGPWKMGCGGTALWHGLYFAARKMRSSSTGADAGRKALIVLSDGMDTGSDKSVADVIEAAEGAGVVVYAIKYQSPLRFLSPALTLRQAFARGMERISLETGGLTFPDPKRKVSEVFSQIEAELRNLYVLGFVPPEEARDGKFHKLKAVVSRPEVVVRTRAGYRGAKATGQD